MDPHSIALITTLFLVFISAIVGGIIAKWFRLPALVGYIASGVMFGNLLSGIIDQEFLGRIADVGVTLLLFTLGVEFSFHRLRQSLGRIAWVAIIQILFCILLFLFFFLWLGFAFTGALYIAIAASLSSTAIVVKVLSERGELESVPGELTTAWLVVQDLAVIPIMMLLPTLASFSSVESVSVFGVLGAVLVSLVKSGGILLFVWYLGRKGIPRLLSLAAASESREIFLLSVIGIVFLCAIVTYAAGLSAALGAFIAGLLISETSQNHAIFAEIRPLRDLFAVVFFVSLGMVLHVSEIVPIVPVLLLAAAMVVAVKSVLIFGLSRFMGNHRKTAFLVAIALTSMSEFGFIIGHEGVLHGALDKSTYGFIVALTFMTVLAGTAGLSHGHTLYYWFYRILGKWLPKLFSTKQELHPNPRELPYADHIVICGYGRVGKYIGRALDMAEVSYVVVDYNQNTIEELRKKDVHVVYGDPADKDVLDYAQVDLARAVIIAIPDRHTQQMIIANAQTLNRRIRIICRTHHEEDQKWLKSLGVQTIIQPEFEAALSVINRLLTDLGVSPDDIAGKVSRLKIEHGLG